MQDLLGPADRSVADDVHLPARSCDERRPGLAREAAVDLSVRGRAHGPTHRPAPIRGPNGPGDSRLRGSQLVEPRRIAGLPRQIDEPVRPGGDARVLLPELVARERPSVHLFEPSDRERLDFLREPQVPGRREACVPDLVCGLEPGAAVPDDVHVAVAGRCDRRVPLRCGRDLAAGPILQPDRVEPIRVGPALHRAQEAHRGVALRPASPDRAVRHALGVDEELAVPDVAERFGIRHIGYDRGSPRLGVGHEPRLHGLRPRVHRHDRHEDGDGRRPRRESCPDFGLGVHGHIEVPFSAESAR